MRASTLGCRFLDRCGCRLGVSLSGVSDVEKVHYAFLVYTIRSITSMVNTS